MINITMPEPFLSIERWELINYKKSIEIKHCNRGIYVFHNDAGEPLYVGKSRRLYRRLRDHIMGCGDSERFSSYISKITLYPVDNLSEMDIYETYAINTIQPIYNRDKVYYTGEHKKQLEFRSGELDGQIDLKRDVLGDLYQQREMEGETYADADPAVTQSHELLSYGNLLYLNREIEREKEELRKLLRQKGVIDSKIDSLTVRKT